MKHIKIMRWVGVAGAVLMPALAVAALEVPNTFAAGQRVSAAEMNANFAALEAKVEELETRLNMVGFDLDSSGNVRRDSTGSSDAWISLDGLSFHAGE